MSYQTFQQINAWIRDHAENTVRRRTQNALIALGGAQGVMQSLASEYARRYALVQRLKYDSSGDPTDVTPQEQLTVPENVFSNAISSLKTLLERAGDIKPVSFGDLTIEASIDGCDFTRQSVGDGTNQLVLNCSIRTSQSGDLVVNIQDASTGNVRPFGLVDPYDQPGWRGVTMACLTDAALSHMFCLPLYDGNVSGHRVHLWFARFQASSSNCYLIASVDGLCRVLPCSNGVDVVVSDQAAIATSSDVGVCALNLYTATQGSNPGGVAIWVANSEMSAVFGGFPMADRISWAMQAVITPAAQPRATIINASAWWQTLLNEADDVTSALSLLQEIQPNA